MDKARKETDKILRQLENRISRLYASDPFLLNVTQKYERYMEKVERSVAALYDDYLHSGTEDREKTKKAYMEAVEGLTRGNSEYISIVAEFERVIADVNQRALDIVNEAMTEIYVINYNQISIDCRKVGIEVNGKTEI